MNPATTDDRDQGDDLADAQDPANGVRDARHGLGVPATRPMRVQLRGTLAGPALAAGPGDVLVVSTALGAALIAAGYATPAIPGPQCAAAPPPETAAVPPQRRRRG